MICSESTSALGQPRLTKPTFGTEGVGTAGVEVCDIGWVRRIAVTMATNGDRAAGTTGLKDHKKPTPAKTPRTRNPPLYRAGGPPLAPSPPTLLAPLLLLRLRIALR